MHTMSPVELLFRGSTPCCSLGSCHSTGVTAGAGMGALPPVPVGSLRPAQLAPLLTSAPGASPPASLRRRAQLGNKKGGEGAPGRDAECLAGFLLGCACVPMSAAL